MFEYCFDFRFLEGKKSSSQKGISEKKVRYNLPTPKEQNQTTELKEAVEGELQKRDISGYMQSSSDSTTLKLLNSKEPGALRSQTAREFDDASQSQAKIESVPKRATSKGITKLMIYSIVWIGIDLLSFGGAITLSKCAPS